MAAPSKFEDYPVPFAKSNFPSLQPCRGICNSRKNRWGIILAGGDGARLRKLTQLICGDNRPKQFCPLAGHETLLEQTRRRTEKSIPWRRILYSLSGSQHAFYAEEPGIRPSQRIVQPANKGTAPPILHGLLSIQRIDDEALVAVLPSDHHYVNEPLFTAALESAFDIAERNPGSVVLLGAHPHGPETEYGWIELGPSVGVRSFQVRGFCEKPLPPLAGALLERGSLWNTFVMVGHVRGFLEMARAALPGLVSNLGSTPLWAGSELPIRDSFYSHLRTYDFSHEVLSTQASRLIALDQGYAGWSNLGSSERVIALHRNAYLPPRWLQEWQALERRLPVTEIASLSQRSARRSAAS